MLRIASRVALGLVKIKLAGELQPTKAYIRSEFVAKCFEAVGIDLAPDREGFMAPTDIAADPAVVPIAALCPDPADVGVVGAA